MREILGRAGSKQHDEMKRYVTSCIIAKNEKDSLLFIDYKVSSCIGICAMSNFPES